MILNSKSLIQKVKFNDSSISHIYEHNSCVKKSWASLSSSTGVWNADTSNAELASPSLLGDFGSAACNTYFLCKVLIVQVYDITERG